MQSPAWIKLLKRIPSAQHDSLVLLTSIGVEISIQNIVRMEDDYLVVRGRMAGTTDTGRVSFIPYDQISQIGFSKEVKEPEIHAFFGDLGSQAAVTAPAPADAATTAPAKEEPPVPSEIPAAAPQSPVTQGRSKQPATSGIRVPIPSKQALLERLRQARGQGINNSNPRP
jgi:hypothetical protein